MKVRQLGNIFTPTSDKEMERRWKAVREKMVEKDIDCILLYANQMKQAGGFRYFIDYPTYDTYGSFAIFPKEGGMAVFRHGTEGGFGVDPKIAKNAEVNCGYPWAAAFPYTWKYLAEEALKFLKHRGYKKFGLYRSLNLPYYMVKYFQDRISGLSLTDFDEELDYIKAIKSDEEIEILKGVVKLHDSIFAALPLLVRPGKPERVLSSEIHKLCHDMGCETVSTRVGTHSGGKAKHKDFLTQNDVIKEGDSVNVLAEFSGPGNYYAELARIFIIGEPSAEQLKADADCLEVQDICARIAKPGVRASELMKALHKFQEERGYVKETRIFSHGQGLDLVERPNCVYDEPMVFAENMYISIHPGMETEKAYAYNADNFLITKDSAVRLTQTPRGLLTL